MRENIEFTSEGTICRGWLDRPDNAAGTTPLVLMAHGFGATRDMHLEQYAQRFNAIGCATLLFDYRNFGASDGQPRAWLDPDREIADWQAALAFARTLPGIDRRRIVLWGTSFAGGLVISVAGRDRPAPGEAIAATISQCPMLDGLASGLEVARYAGVGALARLSAIGMADAAGALLGRPPRYIPIVAKPGEVGAMTTADAWDGYLKLVTPGFRNEVTARTTLKVPLFRPIQDAPNVKCPALFVVCTKDSVAPAAIAEKAAGRIPKAEVVRFPVGHFDVYFGPDFERSVGAMEDFLRRHIGAAR
ncbi:MAG: alpha/beta hydrolase [Gammaproteobacteria bacterium]